MIQNQLKIVVLKTISNKELSGYDLIKEIHLTTGHWKPSFGSIYPLLKDLHSKKLVEVKEEGRRKIYSITPLGKKALKDILESRESIMKTMSKDFKVMESICSDKDKHTCQQFMNLIQKNEVPFAPISKESEELHRIMIILMTNGQLQKNTPAVRKILQETIHKLKKYDTKK